MLITVRELRISSEDVKTFSNKEDLLKLKTELDSLLIVLNSTLERMKIEYSNNKSLGNYSRYSKLKMKKKLYGVVSQLMQIRIGELSKIEKAKNRNSFYEFLIKGLKENVDRELFLKIVEDSKLAVMESQSD